MVVKIEGKLVVKFIKMSVQGSMVLTAWNRPKGVCWEGLNWVHTVQKEIKSLTSSLQPGHQWKHERNFPVYLALGCPDKSDKWAQDHSLIWSPVDTGRHKDTVKINDVSWVLRKKLPMSMNRLWAGICFSYTLRSSVPEWWMEIWSPQSFVDMVNMHTATYHDPKSLN